MAEPDASLDREPLDAALAPWQEGHPTTYGGPYSAKERAGELQFRGLTPPAKSAEEQAETIRMFLDAGVSTKTGLPLIFQVFEPVIGEKRSMLTGQVGSPAERATRKNIFSQEVEELLEPKYLDLIEQYYGATEVDIPRKDAGSLEKITTSILGRPPGESEQAAIETAIERTSTTTWLKRYIAEKLGGHLPSGAEMRGEAEDDATVAAKLILGAHPYQPVADVAKEYVELKHFGRVPLRDPAKFKKETAGAYEAMRWFAELPMGETADGKEFNVGAMLIGEILATDLNLKYGTPDRQFTVEDLDIRMQDTASGKKFTFQHPDPDIGRQPIDPVSFDWGDVLDVLPQAYVIFGDVAGAISGTIFGAAVTKGSPGGAFFGATTVGAFGAAISKFQVMRHALKMGEFVPDASIDGWVSLKGGKRTIIPYDNIFNSVVTEAAWSAGGAVLGSALFRLSSAFFSKGGTEAESFIRKADWDDAYKRWGENKFGRKYSEAGIDSPALIMERAAAAMKEEAQNLTGNAARELIKRAARLDASATQLRQMELKHLPEAYTKRMQVMGMLEEGTRTIDGKVIPPAQYGDAGKFGKQVETALREGDSTRINNILLEMDVANDQLTRNWQQMFADIPPGGEGIFGRDLRKMAEKVLGSNGVPADRTLVGIHGALNVIRNAGRRYGRKPWNLQAVSDQIDKDIRRIGKKFPEEAGAYPSEIQKTILSFREGAIKQEGIPASVDEVRQIRSLVDTAIKRVGEGETQRRLFNLRNMLVAAEGKGFKAISTRDNPLYDQWLAARDKLKNFRAIWTNGFEKGLTDLNNDQLANKFLKQMNDGETVTTVLGQLRQLGLYGRKQEDLLRNILKTRLRTVLTKEMTPGEGVSIAGQTRSVKIGEKRFGTETLTGANFNKFLNEYEPWIKQLFPDDPTLEKFAEKVVRSDTLTSRYKQIARMESDLKGLPFLQGQRATDLQRLAIEAPNKLFDMAWQTGRASIDNARSIRELKRILKRGLSPEEYGIAEQRLQAMTLRKIWDPSRLFAGTETGLTPVAQATADTWKFLDQEESVIKEVFDDAHYDNLRLLFQEMNAVSHPVEAGVAGLAGRTTTTVEAGVWQDIKKIPGLVAKVWVGVLNRKARALHLGTTVWNESNERAFNKLLSDPKQLDAALKIRQTRVGKLTANALGSVWGISNDEVQEMLDNFTIIDAQGNVQPVPVQTPRQGRKEALDRILGP
jgi:hypothetical protein